MPAAIFACQQQLESKGVNIEAFCSRLFPLWPQDPADVGLTGLLWLFLSYGYALFYAANMIGEGSELLLLVPSMAGLVGGVVLPLLGAVPDGGKIGFRVRDHS